MAHRVARDHPDATITGFEVEQMIARPGAREAVMGLIDRIERVTRPEAAWAPRSCRY